MKQREKTKQSCDKILKAAVAEFGAKGYKAASLNTICRENQISKGLIYHNFKNKDALYLACMKLCFQAITSHLQTSEYRTENVKTSIQNYLRLRQAFFLEYPDYSSLFFQALLYPPVHLRSEIDAIRHEFDRCNAARYKELLEQIPLRDGITKELALEYFTLFQEMFHGYFQKKALESHDVHALAEEHEMNLTKILDYMLYGIAKEELS